MSSRATRCVNGKWLAQSPSGTQRYASQVMQAMSTTRQAADLQLILPNDAAEPEWAAAFPVIRSRLRGTLFEQLAVPWISRGRHLYSMAGPAPLVKRRQTLVMHDAMPFRYPQTFRRAFVAWYRLLYGVLSRTAERVLTVSAFSRTELARTLRVPESRFELAPCGSDHLGEPSGTDPPPFAAGTFALIVGNLVPHKNVAPIASALSLAGVPVAIVGVSQQVFRRADVVDGDTIRLLGRVDDARLQQLYSAAAVLVAPSRYEGFGIPIVEAGRMGCPAVFALGSAMTEVAGDGGVGFHPDDATDCVDKVTAIINDPAQRQQLSDRARCNAQRFSWGRTAGIIFGPELPPGDRNLRVLHVTETFSAGTGTAVVEYARAIRGQGVDSFLLAHDRGSGLLGEISDDSPFVEAELAEPGLLNLWRALRSTVDRLRPDVVHLHSSLAGALGRLQPPLPGRPAVIYSPHCFAFERRDIPPWQRHTFKVAERAMARRTDAFICVSPHEAHLARGLSRTAAVFDVINTFGLGAESGPAPLVGIPGPLRIVTVGRVAPQKDPALFLAILAALRADHHVHAMWVGGGDDDVRSALEAADVQVTGWIALAEVPGRVADHNVYLHTAGWEASVPIAVLDAMIAGVPVVVRRNPAYDGLLPDAWQFDDVTSAVTMCRDFALPDRRLRRVDEQFALLEALRKRGPANVISQAYRLISNAGAE